MANTRHEWEKIEWKKKKKTQNSHSRIQGYIQMVSTKKLILTQKKKKKKLNQFQCGTILGLPKFECEDCGIVVWYEERADKGHQPKKLKYSTCCQQEKVKLPNFREPLARRLDNRSKNNYGKQYWCESTNSRWICAMQWWFSKSSIIDLRYGEF